jgi:hypothetical protein
MSQALQSALNWVNFELRLRPRPELLAQKQAIIAALDAECRATTAIMEQSSIRHPPSPPWVQAAPTGEESFRCTSCNQLLPRSQLHHLYCHSCRTDL